MEIKDIFSLGELFERVQLEHIYADGKTFVDCIPNSSLSSIQKSYEDNKDRPDFNLSAFVHENFTLPKEHVTHFESIEGGDIAEHIKSLWDELTRQKDAEMGSLIPLPYRYIVPGGRFREIYYWDSYFTMLGLKEHHRVDLIENMVDNFAFLLNNYGHIPNGNRTYYLTRSQPPFFSLMVSLLATIKNEDKIYIKYAKELEIEYSFWENGIDQLQPDSAINHVVHMPDGEMLNRYYDYADTPRQESYAEDSMVCNKSHQPPGKLYRNLRAGAESGWDFSSRWFADETNIETIQTTAIVPVDLNCLIYFLEKTIATSKKISGDPIAANSFETKATTRKAAILKYCWNASVNFFCDFNFAEKKQQSIITAAGLSPLFFGIASDQQAAAAATITEKFLLKEGGLATTLTYTGQQWDLPNGWAPLHWMAVTGFENYQQNRLAKEIATRWLSLNEKVFAATGKLMEKYNVVDLTKPAGGGEYPGQDGFGWTNGVYIALKNKYSA